MNPKYRLGFNREGIYVHEWFEASSLVIKGELIKTIKVNLSTEMKMQELTRILQLMINDGATLEDIEAFSAL